MRQCPSHQSRLEAFAAGADLFTSAAARSSATLQLIQASGNVVFCIDGVRAEYADVLSSSVVEAQIKGIGRLSVLVDDELYSRICACNMRQNVPGSVARIAIHDDKFQIEGRHVLLQQRVHDRLYVSLLISHGNN